MREPDGQRTRVVLSAEEEPEIQQRIRIPDALFYENEARKRDNAISEGWAYFTRISIASASIIPLTLAGAVAYAIISWTAYHLLPIDSPETTNTILGFTWDEKKIDRIESLLSGFTTGSVTAFLFLVNSQFGHRIMSRWHKRLTRPVRTPHHEVSNGPTSPQHPQQPTPHPSHPSKSFTS